MGQDMYVTDFERKFRDEMGAMIDAGGYFPQEALTTPPDDDHPKGRQRYKWTNGKLYQDGVQITEWQLQQTLHYFRNIRGEKCFEYCKICVKKGRQTVHRASKKLKMGDPFPEEVKGQYPCSNQSCTDQFEFLSHLMRHEEHEHGITHDWDSYKEDLKENAAIQKCLYMGPGRYAKQCAEDAQPGKLWCKSAKHMEQVQAKINKGLIEYQPDEVE